MEKKRYRFVGTETMLGERRLSRLGDVVELSDEEHACVCGETGLPVVPDEDFETVGFTAEEIKKHGTFGGRVNAPGGFWSKLAKVQDFIGVAAKVARVVNEVKK